MQEDYLRMLRAIRFSVTLGFTIDFNIYELLNNVYCEDQLFKTVSEDRIREELTKMFKHDTYKTLLLLGSHFPGIQKRLFDNKSLS